MASCLPQYDGYLSYFLLYVRSLFTSHRLTLSPAQREEEVKKPLQLGYD